MNSWLSILASGQPDHAAVIQINDGSWQKSVRLSKTLNTRVHKEKTRRGNI